MIEFHCDPPVPARINAHLFTQTVHMRDGARPLGHAIWASTAPGDGVAQLLELWIEPSIRRVGHGRRLLQAATDQARAYQRLHEKNLRRLWVGVGHKSHVVGRSFLTSSGFHHISSTCGVLEDQDMLNYVKSLD